MLILTNLFNCFCPLQSLLWQRPFGGGDRIEHHWSTSICSHLKTSQNDVSHWVEWSSSSVSCWFRCRVDKYNFNGKQPYYYIRLMDVKAPTFPIDVYLEYVWCILMFRIFHAYITFVTDFKYLMSHVYLYNHCKWNTVIAQMYVVMREFPSKCDKWK